MISQTIPPDVTIKYREIQITLFKHVTELSGVPTTLGENLNAIKSGQYQALIEAVRGLPPGKERDAAKRKLPGTTYSGKFDGQRKITLINQHTGLLCLDCDKVPNLDEQLAKLKQDPFSVSVFLSPSGNGIKVIVAIDPSKHKESFHSLSQYYKDKYDLFVDPACKDVSRLTFVSYDPNLYFNENARRWKAAPDISDRILSIARKLKLPYPIPKGERNTSCFKLAAECHARKLDRSEVTEAFI